jgi:hypothetical protein
MVLFVLMLLWSVVAVIAVYRFSRTRDFPRHSAQEPFEPSITSLSSHRETPFSQRRRTLKVCSDCRELVLLDADVCKYCGCALAVAPTVVAPEPVLAVRRKEPPPNSGKKPAT